MTDDRTAEQRAADDQLDEALAACARAYGYLGDDEVIEHHLSVLLVDGLSLGESGHHGLVLLYAQGGYLPNGRTRAPWADEGMLRAALRRHVSVTDPDPDVDP